MPFTTSWLTSRSHLLKLPAVLATVLLGLASCETTGDPTVDLPDTKPTSSAFLDIPVSTATVLLDPAQTLQADRYLVGRLRDEVIGVTEAQGVLNVRPSLQLAALPGNLLNSKLISVELLAPFEVVYGSATTPANLDVFVLKQKLEERMAYKPSSKPVVSQPLAAGLTVPLNATRQVTQKSTDGTGTIITTTVPDMVLRQVLQSGAVANPLLSRVFEKLNTKSFSPADLDDLLPGLVLAPSANHQGSIIGFGRGNLSTQLKFNFSYDSVQTAPLPAVARERSFSLLFGPSPNASGTGAGSASDPLYYTYLVNTRTGSRLASLNGTSDAVPAAALSGRSYLQDGIVLGTRITLGNLASLQALRENGNVAINRAELIVPVVPYTTSVFPNPASFYVLEVDASNKVLLRSENLTLQERVLGAESNPASMLQNSNSTSPYYSFIMTKYLQAYLTPNGFGKDSEGNPLPAPSALVLTPTLRTIPVLNPANGQYVQVPPPLTLNRAVLDANNIRLRVYYSQLR